MVLTDAEAMGPPQILDDPFDDPEGHGSIVTWSKDPGWRSEGLSQLTIGTPFQFENMEDLEDMEDLFSFVSPPKKHKLVWSMVIHTHHPPKKRNAGTVCRTESRLNISQARWWV